MLEERLDLMTRSQEWMEMPQEREEALYLKRRINNDHIQTIFAAEQGWLKRTIAQ